jgi:hypothetical protein
VPMTSSISRAKLTGSGLSSSLPASISSDSMREVIEDLWPELAHKLPPRRGAKNGRHV